MRCIQDEDFDEYEGIYDELNLDEEEEKFRGLVHDDEDSDESDDASEGAFICSISVNYLSSVYHRSTTPDTQQET